jgi:N-acetylmuramoyl-L-alanine amidase
MRLARLLAAVVLTVWWAASGIFPASAATLTGVSAVPALVSVTSDGAVAAGEVFALAGPDRLVVDIPAVVAGPVSVVGAASVRQLRLAAFSPGVARLVMDLDRPVLLESVRSVGPDLDGNWRLELRLKRAEPTEFAAAVAAGRQRLAVRRAPQRLVLEELVAAVADEPAPAAAPTPQEAEKTTPAGAALPGVGTPVQPRAETVAEAAPVAEPPASVVQRPQVPSSPSRARQSRSGGKPLVVVDAGHGGKDVGAISVRGGYEKDVTLAIAREVARELERGGKVRVRLTRDDDRFIPLGGRARIAQAAQADLFISIHADAALNQEARGASVYTLSSTASDAVAARLAARENKADIIGGINLGVEAPDVGDILIELSRRGTTELSVIFADVLQNELSPRIRFRSTFHHFAGFQVLKAPDVPSVLLETGYVSNGEDADFLFSRSGQRRIAGGIARAIERHLVDE